MIAMLLGWTKLPQWALELIVIAAVALAVAAGMHHLIDVGIERQRAADAVATDKLKAATAAKTAELQARATTAEQAYEKEVNDNIAYNSSHPVQPVRLCLAANASGGFMPKAGATHPGDASASTPAANLQPVPAGNSGSGAGAAGPDIAHLLDLLAGKADDISAALREYQNREH